MIPYNDAFEHIKTEIKSVIVSQYKNYIELVYDENTQSFYVMNIEFHLNYSTDKDSNIVVDISMENKDDFLKLSPKAAEYVRSAAIAVLSAICEKVTKLNKERKNG